MIRIPAVPDEGGALHPATPIPHAVAVRVICDGIDYLVYEAGDPLPPDPQPAPEEG